MAQEAHIQLIKKIDVDKKLHTLINYLLIEHNHLAAGCANLQDHHYLYTYHSVKSSMQNKREDVCLYKLTQHTLVSQHQLKISSLPTRKNSRRRAQPSARAAIKSGGN